jgi:hypothetical protein
VAASSHRSRAIVTVLAAAAAVLILPRTVPGKAYDRGIFVSVAERLRAGDRLYTDVWDNKDPLFYWVLALGRIWGPSGDVIVEVGWLVVGSLGALMIASGLGLGRTTSISLSLIATPLILTGGLYEPGATHLPGVALTLVAVGLAIRGRPALAGVTVVGVCAVKLVIAPLVVLLVLLIAARRSWPARSMGRCLAGAAGGLLLVGSTLLLRGELQGYLQTQAWNVAYTGTPVLLGSGSPVAAHLARGLGLVGLIVAAALATVVIASLAIGIKAERPPSKDLLLVRELTGVALMGGLGILALTGMWPHHGQVLYVAAVLAIILVAKHLLLRKPSGAISAAVVASSAALVLSGLLVPKAASVEITSPWDRWSALHTPSPETTAILALASSGEYARLGSHDDHGHAEGLAGWRLVCPRFHLYPWDSPTSITTAAACAVDAPVLIVSDQIRERTGPLSSPAWNAMVRSTEARLAQAYTCTRFQSGRLCQLDDAA